MINHVRLLLYGCIILISLQNCTFLGSGRPRTDDQRYYIVARTPANEKQAFAQSKELSDKDYYSNVYRTRKGRYLVTIGPYQNKERAEAARLAAIGRKHIPVGAFVIAEDDIAFWEPSGGGSGGKKAPIASLECISKVYVVAASYNSAGEAIETARSIKMRQRKYNTAVFYTESGKFLVTIGYLESKQAEARKKAAIRSGLARSTSYLSSGKGFLENIYYSSEFGPDGLPYSGGVKL